MRNLLALTLIITALPSAANVDAIAACTAVAEDGRAGRLVRLPDREVERGLCSASKATALGISTGNSLMERRCLWATEELMKEFQRRWPSRNPKAC